MRGALLISATAGLLLPNPRRRGLMAFGEGGGVSWLARAAGRWDASRLAGSDNDLIATFVDVMGGNDGAATGSSRATLKTAAQNGLNILRFDGVANAYELTTPIDGAGPWTLAAVLKPVGGGMPLMSSQGIYFAGAGRFPSDGLEIGNKSWWQLGAAAAPVGSWEVVIVAHDGTPGGASGMINGAAHPMGGNLGPSPGISGGDLDLIGAYGVGYFGNGDMGELVYWPAVLDDAAKLAVTGALNRKWGI